MDSNLVMFTRVYDNLKGQFIISHDRVYRFVGLLDDEEDYYYCLYDGEGFHLHSCTSKLIPLKGWIRVADYDEFVRLAELNHHDQSLCHLYQPNIESVTYIEKHKDEVLAKLYPDNKFVCGPFWEII